MTQAPAPYQLVIDAWRASTTLHDIGEVVERVAGLLAQGVEADALTLWRVSRDGRQTETLATAAMKPGSPLRMPVRDLSEIAVRAWRDMTAVGMPLRLVSGRGPLHGAFAPEGGQGEGLVVPLHDTKSLLGAMVLWSRRDGVFTDAHATLLGELAAPFDAAVQLHNERDSVSREREALEADRRALLQRLERDDVSDALIGADSGLRDVITRAEQVAPTDAPVLLFGETGAGKEVIARVIHRRSRRASGPIVRVNCGAIPQGLIDSELFGHEKGSFTGAIAARKGWFERADGGTLFLDEIGELPHDAQVRLLHILQDGVFERVGAQRSLHVDVRIVAATHRDLQAMVDAGRFREDLWYRLSVFPIEIPPLRKRPEDIPALATHFAARAGMRIGGSRLALSPADIELLVAYAWPGNVRELASVIERAVILGDGKRLHLSAALGTATTRENQTTLPATTDPETWRIAPLDEAMARHIERALHACHGQVEGKAGAAALLRINPHTLRSRMRKLGIDPRHVRAAAPAPVNR
ncbi:MAG: sigma 54-interacting transcriptional regulator [Cytophagaceae bacterium]|nr:sigma 54-interacting transcriptional regulator [Gemmatimonadaceae bacterium]